MTTPFCDVIRSNLQSGDIIDQEVGEKQARWMVSGDKNRISSQEKLSSPARHPCVLYD